MHTARPELKPSRAFLRVEPPPGERFEVDWGHFGVLEYAGDKRKLYAFALVEAHSRMLYLEFTHSQSFETFVRCHVHAFTHLHRIDRHLSALDYQRATTMIFVIHALNSRMIGTAGAAPASEITQCANNLHTV